MASHVVTRVCVERCMKYSYEFLDEEHSGFLVTRISMFSQSDCLVSRCFYQKSCSRAAPIGADESESRILQKDALIEAKLRLQPSQFRVKAFELKWEAKASGP
jgi:hypothetical protein